MQIKTAITHYAFIDGVRSYPHPKTIRGDIFCYHVTLLHCYKIQ